MKKLFFSIAVMGSIVSSMLATSHDAPDALQAAHYLAMKGIIRDVRDTPTLFALDATLLRQDMAKILFLSLKKEFHNDYICRGIFADITATSHANNLWICEAVETLADAWIVSKNLHFAPTRTLSRAEALKLAWYTYGMKTPPSSPRTNIVDSRQKPVTSWIRDLLIQANNFQFIDFEETIGVDGTEYFSWKNDLPMTRGDVFVLIRDLFQYQQVVNTVPQLTMSQEIHSTPHVRLPHNPALIKTLQIGDKEPVMRFFNPEPILARVSWPHWFFLQPMQDDFLRYQTFSISLIDGDIFQPTSNISPHNEALQITLRTLNIANPETFYSLEYGDLWEKSRDTYQSTLRELFTKTPLRYPVQPTETTTKK